MIESNVKKSKMVLFDEARLIERDKHPDYLLHQQIVSNSAICRAAVQRWREIGTPLPVPQYGIVWTAESAAEFFTQLSKMLTVYNDVLWQGFSYCRLCQGKCCTSGVIEGVEVYDLVALELLDEALPILPSELNTSGQRCLYLDGPRCTWPDAWRVYKCWSYYCLGPASVWEKMQDGKSLEQSYAELHKTLIPVIEAHLPQALRIYERTHGVSFSFAASSPTALGLLLQRAINAVLILPLAEAYPELLVLFKSFELA